MASPNKLESSKSSKSSKPSKSSPTQKTPKTQETQKTQKTPKTSNKPQSSNNGSVPVLFAQTVIIALVLCTGEILTAPTYISLSYDSLALVPWASIACLLSVVFAYTVGFAGMWAATKASKKAQKAWQPVIAAIFGLVLFGIWGYLVFAAVLNSIIVPLGHATLTAAKLGSIAFNCGAIGLAATFCASVFGERFAAYRFWVWIAFAITMIFAAAGMFYAVHIAAVL